mmetsp:Transcript_12836/g.34109  ORF Transcript_12836/g.34109 Transcript_12836/m.34109 type:complete len:292 (+) Transcript_12836:1450-2325(+)
MASDEEPGAGSVSPAAAAAAAGAATPGNGQDRASGMGETTGRGLRMGGRGVLACAGIGSMTEACCNCCCCCRCARLPEARLREYGCSCCGCALLAAGASGGGDGENKPPSSLRVSVLARDPCPCMSEYAEVGCCEAPGQSSSSRTGPPGGAAVTVLLLLLLLSHSRLLCSTFPSALAPLGCQNQFPRKRLFRQTRIITPPFIFLHQVQLLQALHVHHKGPRIASCLQQGEAFCNRISLPFCNDDRRMVRESLLNVGVGRPARFRRQRSLRKPNARTQAFSQAMKGGDRHAV